MFPVAVVGNVDLQMPLERFSCQCARERDENRLYRSNGIRGAEMAGIREEFAGLAKARKQFYINGLSQPVSPYNLGNCRVIWPNCRDNAFTSKQKTLASQWLGWGSP